MDSTGEITRRNKLSTTKAQTLFFEGFEIMHVDN